MSQNFIPMQFCSEVEMAYETAPDMSFNMRYKTQICQNWLETS